MLSKLMHFIKSHRYYLYSELIDQEFKKFLHHELKNIFEENIKS